MCLICEMPDGKHDLADDFLTAFAQANSAMRKAEKAMLEISKITECDLNRINYDKVHKEMVRLRKQWNKLEQKRAYNGRAIPKVDRMRGSTNNLEIGVKYYT